MTNDDLRKLAEAAMEHRNEQFPVDCPWQTCPDVLFDRAANPERVIALLDENRRLRTLLLRLDEWDVMRGTGDMRGTHDSPYWRREIAAALADAALAPQTIATHEHEIGGSG